MCKLKCGLCLIFVTFIQICSSTLPLSTHTTESKCFGYYNLEYTVLSLSCPVNSEIAITSITVGAKTVDSNCPEIFDASQHNASCCQQADGDCIIPFDTSFNHRYHNACNGKRQCIMQAQFVLTLNECPSNQYLNTTSYMFIEYTCVPEIDIGTFCSADKTVYDDVLYLRNPEYPGEIAGGTGADCGCSVETDNCDADINVYTIQRNLTREREWSSCVPEQRLTILGSNTGQFLTWSCHDNTLFTKVNTMRSNRLTVNLENTRSGNGGNFWLAFQASQAGNITLRCPAQQQQFCLGTTTTSSTLPTTTSTTQTSTSLDISTPSTPTTTSTSTVTTSTTPTPTVSSTTSTTQTSTSTDISTPSTPTTTSTSTVTTSPTPTPTPTTPSPSSPADTQPGLPLPLIAGAGGGGLVFLIIMVVLIARCTRRQTMKDRDAPNDSAQDLDFVTPYASVYVTPNPRLHDVSRRGGVQERMSTTSTYITPIQDSGYSSIRSAEVQRMNRLLLQKGPPEWTKQYSRQPHSGFAPLRNQTY